MRLTTVILLASLLQVSASTFGQRITMNQKNAALDNVLKEIRRQSGYDILFDGNTISRGQKVNVNLKDVSIQEALKVVLDGLPLTFEISDKHVTIKRKRRLPFWSAWLTAGLVLMLLVGLWMYLVTRLWERP